MTHNDVINKYNELRAYCDGFWDNAVKLHPDQFKCRKGCSICCELQSVNLLEAYNCCVHLLNNRSTGKNTDGRCVFIFDDSCRIYEARPLICRTHGLLLKSPEFTNEIAPSCPFNFETLDFENASRSCVLDIDRITGNLVRLNLAFCITAGDQSLAGNRFSLEDLAEGAVPEILVPLLERPQ